MNDPTGGPDSARDDDSVDVLRHKGDPSRSARVTVIVSLYHYARFVTQCLDSVHAQTLRELDLVVVDDHSADESPEVVADWLDRFGERFASYQLLRNRANRGLARTRNAAFAHAATPFVFVLDADNMLYQRCVERHLSALEQCRASFAFCYAERFGELTGLLNHVPWDPTRFATNNIIDAMVLLRKADWAKVGGYSTDMPVMGWEDFDLWFKLARVSGWGVLVPEVLTRYRVHGTSMLRTVTNPRVDCLWAHLRATYPEFFTTPPAIPAFHPAAGAA
jgi:glycosyltransferase involved in cell wall biosynthesis